MTKKEIVDGSKLIATYLGWKYIPSNDLQGYSKAGWWAVPNTEEEKLSSEVKNHKSKIGSTFFKCRNHTDLRFWNSLDSLVPVIDKIEKNSGVRIMLTGGQCDVICMTDPTFGGTEKDENLSWSNNTFKVIITTLEYLEKQ